MQNSRFSLTVASTIFFVAMTFISLDAKSSDLTICLGPSDCTAPSALRQAASSLRSAVKSKLNGNAPPELQVVYQIQFSKNGEINRAVKVSSGKNAFPIVETAINSALRDLNRLPQVEGPSLDVTFVGESVAASLGLDQVTSQVADSAPAPGLPTASASTTARVTAPVTVAAQVRAPALAAAAAAAAGPAENSSEISALGTTWTKTSEGKGASANTKSEFAYSSYVSKATMYEGYRKIMFLQNFSPADGDKKSSIIKIYFNCLNQELVARDDSSYSEQNGGGKKIWDEPYRVTRDTFKWSAAFGSDDKFAKMACSSNSLAKDETILAVVKKVDADRAALKKADQDKEAAEKQKQAKTSKEFPYYALITCGMGWNHLNTLVCFSGEHVGTEIEIRNGPEYGMYKVYDIFKLGRETGKGLEINLRQKFELKVQNADDSLILGVRVYERASGKMLFQKQVGKFGVIGVSN